MLDIPGKNFNESVNKVNVSTNVLADWIEASLLFDYHEISKSNIVDILIEQQICKHENKDIAHEIADRGWVEVQQRSSFGACDSLKFDGMRITGSDNWRNEPIRAFFLLLSIFQYYPSWASSHRNYSEQGELFERVIEVACKGLLPSWDVIRAGWSPSNAVSVKTIVHQLCDHLNTMGNHDIDRMVPDAAKDGGLDIVCVKKFPNKAEAMPTYLLQCASGTNWRDKINTPSTDAWKSYLNAAAQPGAGIVAPFVINTEQILHAGLNGQVVVFDRLRLLYAINSEGIQFPRELLSDVINWIEPKIVDIPKAEELEIDC